MIYRINPILIEIAKNFKAAHTSEPDSVAAIALMISFNYRTDKEPFVRSFAELVGNFEMPEKLARKLHSFLLTQGNLLGQLKNDHDYFGGTYSGILKAAKYVNNDYTLNQSLDRCSPANLGFDDYSDWEWMEYTWPKFVFVNEDYKWYNPKTYQAINKKKLFRA